MEGKEQILLELVKQNKVVFYDILLKKLECSTITEVDQIIISAMKNKLFTGHIDHKQKCLFVSSVKIDSVDDKDIPKMITILNGLSGQCDKALGAL